MDPKDKSIAKRVLLFSGGLDSYLVHRLFKPEVLLYVGCNHKYQDREEKAIKDLKLDKVVKRDLSLDLQRWERTDAIIPLRNMLFAAVASRYGDTIWMGSLRGEINWDKTDEFYWLTSAAMSHCYNASYWSEGRVIKVESPVQHLTKAQLIARAIKEGINPKDWSKTVSCYDSRGFCGQCSSCFKRWVAHTLNGITEKYKVDPLESRESQLALEKVREGTYTGIRAIETATAICHAKKIWPVGKPEVVQEVAKRIFSMRNEDFSCNA